MFCLLEPAVFTNQVQLKMMVARMGDRALEMAGLERLPGATAHAVTANSLDIMG